MLTPLAWYSQDGGYIPRILFADSEGQVDFAIYNQGGNPKYKCVLVVHQWDRSVCETLDGAIICLTRLAHAGTSTRPTRKCAMQWQQRRLS